MKKIIVLVFILGIIGIFTFYVPTRLTFSTNSGSGYFLTHDNLLTKDNILVSRLVGYIGIWALICAGIYLIIKRKNYTN